MRISPSLLQNCPKALAAIIVTTMILPSTAYSAESLSPAEQRG
jgi:hypothetical protein